MDISKTGFLMCLSLVALISWCSDGTANPCKTLNDYNHRVARDICAREGMKVLSPDDPKACPSAHRRVARKNADWVIFDDKGAKQTAMGAIATIRRNCPERLSDSNAAIFHAIVEAQSHNRKAQCSLYECKAKMTGIAGYLRWLRASLIKDGKVLDLASAVAAAREDYENAQARERAKMKEARQNQEAKRKAEEDAKRYAPSPGPVFRAPPRMRQSGISGLGD